MSAPGQNATQERFQRTTVQMIGARRTRLDRASARLEALSPVAVLSRGYALVYAADGALLRSAASTDAGETIHVSLARGWLEAKVMRTMMEEADGTETNN